MDVIVGVFGALVVAIVLLVLIRLRQGESASEHVQFDAPERDDMTFVQHKEDMRSAIAKAKSTMDVFWNAYESQPDIIEGGVKIGLSSNSSELEHVWLSDLSRDGRVWRGNLAVDPNDIVDDLAFGDVVEFAIDQVTDWFYEDADGRCRGHFTTRILIADWTDEQKEASGVLFHEDPIP
jgi:uncharacterized protein YegJ (DUF2314 family)